MQIRLMKTEDYGRVLTLWKNTPGMGLNSFDDSEEGITAYLARNPKTCFVAIEGERLIGTVLSGHDGRRGHIYHLAVDESCRRSGVGRALVQAAVNALKAEHINKVSFLVFEKNETGNAFWEALGFKKRTDVAYRDRIIGDC